MSQRSPGARQQRPNPIPTVMCLVIAGEFIHQAARDTQFVAYKTLA
jgi:hypothetical protein